MYNLRSRVEQASPVVVYQSIKVWDSGGHRESDDEIIRLQDLFDAEYLLLLAQPRWSSRLRRGTLTATASTPSLTRPTAPRFCRVAEMPPSKSGSGKQVPAQIQMLRIFCYDSRCSFFALARRHSGVEDRECYRPQHQYHLRRLLAGRLPDGVIGLRWHPQGLGCCQLSTFLGV